MRVSVSIYLCSQASPATNNGVSNSVNRAHVFMYPRWFNGQSSMMCNLRDLETCVSSPYHQVSLCQFKSTREPWIKSLSVTCLCLIVVGSGENLCDLLNQRICASRKINAGGEEASSGSQIQGGTETSGSEVKKNAMLHRSAAPTS